MHGKGYEHGVTGKLDGGGEHGYLLACDIILASTFMCILLSTMCILLSTPPVLQSIYIV